MRAIVKIFIASVVIIAVGVATLLCCCVAPAVAAHWHKPVVAVCGHCASSGTHHSSNPAAPCQGQLTSTDTIDGQIVLLPQGGLQHFIAHPVFKASSTFHHSLSLVFPPGGPPGNLTPLYLRTFNLRV